MPDVKINKFRSLSMTAICEKHCQHFPTSRLVNTRCFLQGRLNVLLEHTAQHFIKELHLKTRKRTPRTKKAQEISQQKCCFHVLWCAPFGLISCFMGNFWIYKITCVIEEYVGCVMDLHGTNYAHIIFVTPHMARSRTTSVAVSFCELGWNYSSRLPSG